MSVAIKWESHEPQTAFVDSQGGTTQSEKPHYHVVEFINGCLNDYDSGPIETIGWAREVLKSHVNRDFSYGDDDEPQYQEVGQDKYVSEIRILTIEECNNPIHECRQAEIYG